MAGEPREITFTPEAEDEMLSAGRRYEEEEPGLGCAFLTAVDEAIRISTRETGPDALF